MPRNGLSKEKAVQAAAALIARSGTADFSMRALADSLNIKTASLSDDAFPWEFWTLF